MTSVFPSLRISHDISCCVLITLVFSIRYFFPLTNSHISPLFLTGVLPLCQNIWAPVKCRCVVPLVAVASGCYDRAMWQRMAAFQPPLSFPWGFTARSSTACIVELLLTDMSNFHDYGWECSWRESRLQCIFNGKTGNLSPSFYVYCEYPPWTEQVVRALSRISFLCVAIFLFQWFKTYAAAFVTTHKHHTPHTMWC